MVACHGLVDGKTCVHRSLSDRQTYDTFVYTHTLNGKRNTMKLPEALFDYLNDIGLMANWKPGVELGTTNTTSAVIVCRH
jgi:hypothetical protein